jgi:thiol-disulfide isomerase/thioredoxin
MKSLGHLAAVTVLTLALSGVAAATGSHWVAAQPAAGRPWLGVEFDAPRPASRGARVRHAVRSSPAWKAGVRDGDIIVRADDVTVLQAEQVIRRVAGHAPGEALRLSLLRAGQEVSLTATLEELPDSDEMLRLDKVGSPAPSWQKMSTVAGALPGGLQELKGRVVIVDFWATWCMACRMAAPRLSAWQARFGAQGLSVIGITDDPVAEASEGVTSFGMKYAGIGTDPSNETQRAFGVRALPTVFVIDKRGVVRDVSVGFDPRRESETEQLLQRLLAETVP